MIWENSKSIVRSRYDSSNYKQLKTSHILLKKNDRLKFNQLGRIIAIYNNDIITTHIDLCINYK